MSTVTAATKGKESKLGPTAAIIVTLAGVLITIVTLRTSFPVPYYVAAILLLLAIFALLIYGFLASPIYEFVKKKKEVRKLNALAREYFGEFKHFTEIFGEFLIQSRNDNIPYALKNLFGNPTFRGVPHLSIGDFYNIFNCYKERLERFDRTKEDFSLLVNEFESILDIYNKYCIVEPIREIRVIGREKVDEQTKENYKKQKVTYERFIGNYIDFGKKRNGEFGERIFREYFEMPEEL